MDVVGRGGRPRKWLFVLMDLYIYSDESGTFDVKHNEFFIFGGIIAFGDDQRQDYCRLFAHAETTLKESRPRYQKLGELKACFISNKDKGKLYRSLKSFYRFAVIIEQPKLRPEVFENRYHKQRYLDFAYKIVVKKYLSHLKDHHFIDNVSHIHVHCDEHVTCTDGIYELRESLLNEFKNGVFNSNYETFFPPLFPGLHGVEVKFMDSKTTLLIRASDIIANHFYHMAIEYGGNVPPEDNCFILRLPSYEILSYGDQGFIARILGQQENPAVLLK